MAKIVILKNTTASDLIFLGLPIIVGGQVDFTEEILADLVAEPDLESLILSGDLVVNDGVNDLAAIDGVIWVFGGSTVTNIFAAQLAQILNVSPNNTNSLFVFDPVRNKTLSTDMDTYLFGEHHIQNNDWVTLTNYKVKHSDAGYIVPFDGTIVAATGWGDDVPNNVYGHLELWINNTNKGNILTLPSGDDVKASNITLDIDFNANDKIRLRGNILKTSGGSSSDRIDEGTFKIFSKWRTS